MRFSYILPSTHPLVFLLLEQNAVDALGHGCPELDYFLNRLGLLRFLALLVVCSLALRLGFDLCVVLGVNLGGEWALFRLHASFPCPRWREDDLLAI